MNPVTQHTSLISFTPDLPVNPRCIGNFPCCKKLHIHLNRLPNKERLQSLILFSPLDEFSYSCIINPLNGRPFLAKVHGSLRSSEIFGKRPRGVACFTAVYSVHKLFTGDLNQRPSTYPINESLIFSISPSVCERQQQQWPPSVSPPSSQWAAMSPTRAANLESHPQFILHDL